MEKVDPKNNIFPSHLIDPRDKNARWILDYAKAAWYDSSQHSGIFYHKSWKYREIKDYALGNQSINQYKKTFNLGDEEDTTYLNIDWRILPVITKFRRIALNKLKKLNYSIEAQAVDSVAVNDKENYIAEQKAKLAFKERLQQENPDLVQKITSEDDAENYDDLKIKELYTYKHNAAIELENGIDLILNQNNIETNRGKIMEDLFDYGVAGYKDWIDSAGNVRFRRVNPATMLTSYCIENDFKDKQYAGEVVRMTIADLKQAAGDQFTEDEYREIADMVRGKWGNPTVIPTPTLYSSGYDDFHIDVMDLEFYSVNEAVYEKRINKRGNPVMSRTSYTKRGEDNGKEYKRIAYKVVYTTQWIISTDFQFNYGLATNMKRAKSNMTDVEMSYNFYAPEFFDMQAKGITEQLIPLANSIQIAWYKLQNAINQARPKGVEIDIDGLEDIPLGAGGKSLDVTQVLDLFNEKGVLVYRRRDLSGEISNYKPIQEIENGLGKDAVVWFEIIRNDIQMIRDITGMNEYTDGSTPDPRALTATVNMAVEGSNNALGDVVTGDQLLLKKLGTSLYMRLQDAVKYGNIKGYAKSLGEDSVRFIEATSNISAHEFGIFLTLSMSNEEKMQFKAKLEDMAAKGIIDPDTAIMVGNIKNKDQAEQVLAYKVKQKREQDLEKARQDQITNGQIQRESAMMAEEEKRKTAQIEINGKIQLERVKGEEERKTEEVKGQIQRDIARSNNVGKIQNTAVQAAAKLDEKELDMVKNNDVIGS